MAHDGTRICPRQLQLSLKHGLQRAIPRCRAVNRHARGALLQCCLPTRPGFQSVEEGARQSAAKEAEAAYEYSTHQGLEMEEVEEAEAEVRHLQSHAAGTRAHSNCGSLLHMSAEAHVMCRCRWTFWGRAHRATCI